MFRVTVLVLSLAISGTVLCASTAAPSTTGQSSTASEAPTTTPVPTQDPKRFIHTKNHELDFPEFKAPANESDRKFDKFTFVQAADPQFGLIQFNKDKKQNVWDEEKEKLKHAVKEWNEMNPRPKFVVINGDLANALPNKKEQELRDKQMKDLLAEFDNLNSSIPLVFMPGNHDIDTNTTTGEVTADTLKQYNDQFGDDYFAFYVNNVKFIVLNTEFYRENNEKLQAAKDQGKFLDAQLTDVKKSKYTHTVVLQHMPWFIGNIDNNATDKDWARVPEKQARRVLEKLEDAGVHNVFTGHYHENGKGTYKNITMDIVAGLGYNKDTKSGYNVVTVDEKEIKVEYHEIKTGKPNSASAMALTSTMLFVGLLVAFFTL